MNLRQRSTQVLTVTAVAVILCSVLLIASFFSRTPKGRLEVGKLASAIHAFCLNAKEQNKSLPASISLQDLIAQGFLKHEDVSAFDGMKVTVFLTADSSIPQATLMRAELPDGTQLDVLADGSVQGAAK